MSQDTTATQPARLVNGVDAITLVNDATASHRIHFAVANAIVFDVSLKVEIVRARDGHPVYRGDSARPGGTQRWLPRGEYSADWIIPRMALRAGEYRMYVRLWGRNGTENTVLDESELSVTIEGELPQIPPIQAQFHFASECDVRYEDLPWHFGHDNWFYRHFDHAAHVIGDYMLDNTPLLSGRVLDVGCGDGITDLGLHLRYQPELLVGIDPARTFDMLPRVLADNQLDVEIPDNLILSDASANDIPYDDDSFDVVVSWGSVEHIVPGYQKALEEMRRVLRPGGMLFIHPGLYYGNLGHHLGEFSTEPFFHLTKTDEEIKELVFSKEPDLMDRAGFEKVTSADFWRFYQELNPITVSDFEAELRALDFEFFRAAVRTEGRVEYNHPKLQNHSIHDLSTLELYLSAYNRK